MNLYQVTVQLALGHHGLQVDAALFLLLKDNIRRVFVEPDAESFEFFLNDALVLQRLQDVQNDEYQGACSCNSNDLSTSTLAVFSSLDDAG